MVSLTAFFTFLSFGFCCDEDHLGKMLKRNHKLNPQYVRDLNDNSKKIYVSKGRFSFRKSKKDKLIIYYPSPDYKKHMNPDAMEIRYEYNRFNNGNLRPVFNIPIKTNPRH